MVKRKAGTKKSGSRPPKKRDVRVTYECRTKKEPFEFWVSKINTLPIDGAFTIDPPDAQGYFTGTHLPAGVSISGRCLGTGIWFLLPEANSRYLYTAVFQGSKKLKGNRINLQTDLRAKRADKLVAPDDWEADKTT